MAIAKNFLLLSLSFLVLSHFALGLNSFLLGLSDDSSPKIILGNENLISETVPSPQDPFIFAALPSFDEQIKTSVKTADARQEIIRQYLHKFESPLEPYAKLIVDLSDQYNFDYRWLVAIAQQESNLCKHIPDDSYNCWGWGIYPDPNDPSTMKITRFDNFEDALRRIAPQFTRIFLKGRHSQDPTEVMKTYTPPSDGSWADGVSQFFEHLE